MDEQSETRETLAAVAAARAAAADRLVTPWWYHPILGVLLGLLVVTYGLGGTWVRLAGVAVFLSGVALLVQAYRRLTGVWISGYRSGPASRWAYVMGGVAAAGMVAAIALEAAEAAPVWTWAIAAVVAVATVLTGHRYDRALRAQLRGES